MSLQLLLTKIANYYPSYDQKIIKEAYLFAEKAHQGQFRNSGEEYINHPLKVACILIELELDTTTIVAALLHDVVEDTFVTIEEIENKFGKEVGFLVSGVTKLSKIEYKSKEDRQAENLRRMFLAMARDVRVILIKLADRLHNMRTLNYHPVAKQQEIAKETLEIFAPLAHRLGIYKIKWEIEDLAFRFLEEDKYHELAAKIAKKRREREDYINLVISKLTKQLKAAGIQFEISGRPKNLYSIYRKMVDQQKDLAEIYDLTAVRVIVNTVRECYAVLGVVHTMWKPIPGRFKDYIAMPKQNMYQSLHTTLVGPMGDPFELQIRTWEMHRTAEYGIAAHWRYKEKEQSTKTQLDEKLSWLRQILEWQHDLKDAKEFMETLKIDLFSDVVFVFTPKGDVVELPAGSVPLDFAYRIHTEIGHKCIGAKINGKIVPLDYKLANGDIVEILTSKQSNGPSRDWLAIVKSSHSKSRIRQWFNRGKKEESILRGRELIEKEIRKIGANPADFFKLEKIDIFARELGYQSQDDLYAGIGNGTVNSFQVISKVKEDLLSKKEEALPLTNSVMIQQLVQPFQKKRKGESPAIKVSGEGNFAVRLAHCCKPLPGDAVIGYITRGRGVTVHRADCSNIVHYYQNEPERLIEVKWDYSNASTYLVELEVTALDRPRLATDIMNIIADTKTIINAVNARAKKDKTALVNLKLEIRDLEHLCYIMQKIGRVSDVLEVHRVVPS